MKTSIDRVRAIVKTLPNVDEGTTFGYPAFKVGGKVFAWFPKKKEVEPGSIGIRVSMIEREYLIAAEPAIYYVTPHYKDYPSVLARVNRMSDDKLVELLEAGHEFMRSRSDSGRAKQKGR